MALTPCRRTTSAMAAAGGPGHAGAIPAIRHPACDPSPLVTLLSPRATAFHGRHTRDGFNPPAEEWRPPAQPPRAVLDALWRAMAAHDLETAQHALRVMHLAVAVAPEPELEDAGMIASIRGAAPLHDIGKLAVPNCLLNRPGPLSSGEYEVVKRHA